MSYLIKSVNVINESSQKIQDVLIKNQRIERIDSSISDAHATEISGEGKWLLPGVIDDQVHFREPGLTHKANIYTESRAAVAGGVTSFMEMPNTVPQALTQELLADKYAIGAQSSLANYSFFMGASNENIEEVLKTDPKTVCGLKIFMGSSTGNMLVDNRETLEGIFSRSPMLIALHCEDEATVRKNTAIFKEKYGEDIPMSAHPIIRDVEACYKSSSLAVELAKKYGTRIHVLHISTAKELELFSSETDLSKKQITSEVCVHHLSFNDSQYEELGSQIKCNPAIKSKSDQDALWEGLKNGKLDIIATDHAPHTWEEKQGKYSSAPSGLPLVQHTLQLMLEHAKDGRISVEDVVKFMCHRPAEMFKIIDRGFIREGYFADLVLVDPNKPYTVNKQNLLFKCGWSPFEGKTFQHSIDKTFISGQMAWSEGKLHEYGSGMRLAFDR
jgi:dihydroorotase